MKKTKEDYENIIIEILKENGGHLQLPRLKNIIYANDRYVKYRKKNKDRTLTYIRKDILEAPKSEYLKRHNPGYKGNVYYSVSLIKNSKPNFYPDELPKDDKTIIEGAKETKVVNRYERSDKARNECIAYHGTICKICGFDFEKVYGDMGKGFIHVHHIKPLSEIGESYEVDPINDLIPVCPNCHAMIHSRSGYTYEIEEIKSRVKKAKID